MVEGQNEGKALQCVIGVFKLKHLVPVTWSAVTCTSIEEIEHSYLLLTGLVIGFSQTSYTVSEAAATATLTVRIISETPETEVSAVFSTGADSAVGKLADNSEVCLS